MSSAIGNYCLVVNRWHDYFFQKTTIHQPQDGLVNGRFFLFLKGTGGDICYTISYNPSNP